MCLELAESSCVRIEQGSSKGVLFEELRQCSHIGDQLELELAGPGRVWREPWEGMSPRALTKVAQMLSLGAPPAGGLRAPVGVCRNLSAGPADSQLDLFL